MLQYDTLERLNVVFDRNNTLIEKAKKDLRNAVDVVDQVLRNATGQGLQDQAATYMNSLQQQSSTHLQHQL